MIARYPHLHAATDGNGGARRDRTDDLKLAKLALSQLSYGPIWRTLVGPGRFELPTPRLSSVCSNQLSYGPSPAACAPIRPDKAIEHRNWARNHLSPSLAPDQSRSGRQAAERFTEEKRGRRHYRYVCDLGIPPQDLHPRASSGSLLRNSRAQVRPLHRKNP